MRREKYMNGYMTLEAALIVPFVCIVIVLLVGLLLYQYDRCRMDQNVGILAVRGVLLDAGDNHERMEGMKRNLLEMDESKYMVISNIETDLAIKNGEITVAQSAKFVFPFEEYGKIESKSTSHLFSPVMLLREWKRINNIKREE